MSEYTEKTGKLNNLEMKVRETKESIKNKLKAIQHSEDKNAQKVLYQEIVQAHLEMKKATKDYNSVRQEIKYKFPKKSDQTVRRYLPLREVTLDEIENETGMSGVLSRVKKKIDIKYKKFTLADKNKSLLDNQENSKEKLKNKKKENAKDKIILER